MTWTSAPRAARLRYSLPAEAARPTVAELDLGALVHNLNAMRMVVGESRIAAVVKAIMWMLG